DRAGRSGPHAGRSAGAAADAGRRAGRCRVGRQGHPHLPARRQGRSLRRGHGGDEPPARRRLPEGGAGGRREGAVPGRLTPVGLGRWLACAAIVVLAHAGLAAAMVRWTDPLDPAEPSATIVVELAPISAAPTPVSDEVPPGPDQVQAEAVPEKPVEEIKKEEPDVAPAPDPEVAVAAKLPEPEPPKPDSSVPAPITSAPQAQQLALATVPAAPVQGTPKPSDSTAIPTWRSRIAAALERNKRYPKEARARRQQGVTQVAFTLDRSRHLLDSRIVRGPGSAALDDETLQLLRRAQPFPPPPPELAGDKVDLIVPVRFNLR